MTDPDFTPPPPTAVDRSAPACADDSLQMHASFAAPVEGHPGPVRGVLEIRNTGKSTCRFQSKFEWYPVGTRPPRLAQTDELGPPAVLEPGAVAVSRLSWSGQECDGTTDLSRITVVPLSDDRYSRRDVPAAGLVRGECERPHGDAGTGSWATALTPDNGVLRLIPSMAPPPSVRGYQALTFHVTLTNPTPEPVLLDPDDCPVVRFWLGEADRFLPGQSPPHRLNCAAVPGSRIAPSQSVRFEFSFGTPSQHGADWETALHWRFDHYPEVRDSAPVTITL